MRVYAPIWGATAATTCGEITVGTWYWESTKGYSRKSEEHDSHFSSKIPAGVNGPATVASGDAASAAAAGTDGSAPFVARFLRGRMSYRLIISFSVVVLMCNSSAAR